MNSALASTTPEIALTEEVATRLLPRASALTRVVLKQAKAELSRSEAGVLASLDRRPRRVSELADNEGLAQPTMTVIVQRLEQRGFVLRERDPADGRVVVVSLTSDGAAALERLRAAYRSVLRERIASLSQGQIRALAAATDALDALVDALQEGGE